MRIRVYIRDAHTCYRLRERQQLGELMARGPASEKPGVDAEVGHFNPTTGEYLFAPVRLYFLSKAAVGVVEADEYAVAA